MVFMQSCKYQNGSNIKITPLTVLTKTDTFTSNNMTSIDRTEYYLVDGNMNDTSTLYKKIDDFIKTKEHTNHVQFSVYNMEFIKITSQLTVEKINANPYILEKGLMLGYPQIVTYMWINGRFGGVIKYKDGKVIN